ncbi:MAG: hypothetical protein GY805_14195 [Chloroflexi bacterium]|nr:hypothetical protein [Chloroflexota bacterium]
MKWKNISSKRSVVFESQMKDLRVSVVCGHVEYLERWVMSTVPDILRGHYDIGPETMTGEEAIKEAELVVRNRLNAIVQGLDA